MSSATFLNVVRAKSSSSVWGEHVGKFSASKRSQFCTLWWMFLNIGVFSVFQSINCTLCLVFQPKFSREFVLFCYLRHCTVFRNVYILDIAFCFAWMVMKMNRYQLKISQSVAILKTRQLNMQHCGKSKKKNLCGKYNVNKCIHCFGRISSFQRRILGKANWNF